MDLDLEQQLTAALEDRAAGVPVSPTDLGGVHARARSIRRRRTAAAGVAGAAVVALVVPVAWGLGGLRGASEPPVAPAPATSTAPDRTCSSTGVAKPALPEGLPAPVAKTWQEIVDAAAACDLDALEVVGAGAITSYGEKQGIGNLRVWEQEGKGELGLLLKVMATTPGLGQEGPVKTWAFPAASVRDPWQPLTPKERTELETFESPATVAQHDVDRMYYGMRVGIQSDGTWSYFVGGD